MVITITAIIIIIIISLQLIPLKRLFVHLCHVYLFVSPASSPTTTTTSSPRPFFSAFCSSRAPHPTTMASHARQSPRRRLSARQRRCLHSSSHSAARIPCALPPAAAPPLQGLFLRRPPARATASSTASATSRATVASAAAASPVAGRTAALLRQRSCRRHTRIILAVASRKPVSAPVANLL